MKPLSICTTFFSHLKAVNVRYCHWKSNSHLAEALAGQTDLDVLIAQESRGLFETALLKYKFKKLISPPEKQFPGMEDYIGFDKDTGKLIHLHVHYKLIMGQKYIKNHHLPLENIILENLRELNGVFVPIAELELLILIIRANMKLGFSTITKSYIRTATLDYPEDILGEIRLLNQDCCKDILKSQFSALRSLGLKEELFFAFIDDVQNDGLTRKSILAIRSHIFQTLKPYCRYGPVVSRWRAASVGFKKIRYIRKIFPATKKTMATGGKVFALIGSDGSGKSSLNEELVKWMSWKVAVKKYYFGIPKGRIIIKYLSRISQIFNRLAKVNLGRIITTIILKTSKRISAIRWLIIARERLRFYEDSKNIIKSGVVGFADRYPLAEFQSMGSPMDGPRIASEYGTQNKMSIKEENYYSRRHSPKEAII